MAMHCSQSTHTRLRSDISQGPWLPVVVSDPSEISKQGLKFQKLGYMPTQVIILGLPNFPRQF